MERLRELLTQAKQGLERTVTPDYDSPSWSHKQAHLNGRLEQIERILKLLKGTNSE